MSECEGPRKFVRPVTLKDKQIGAANSAGADFDESCLLRDILARERHGLLAGRCKHAGGGMRARCDGGCNRSAQSIQAEQLSAAAGRWTARPPVHNSPDRGGENYTFFLSGNASST